MSENKNHPGQNGPVVVIGASNNPDRYSYKAIEELARAGLRVIPVHPALDTVQEIPVTASLTQIDGPVDTVTLYVNPARLQSMREDIVRIHPRRVIFNPGTESEDHAEFFRQQGIRTVNACTIVLCKTGQFADA